MTFRRIVLAAALLGLTAPARADLVLPRVSSGATVKQTIGTTDFTVAYSRPGVKGRAIWGALVPFDKPWRTGANEATTFTTTDDIMVAGQKLAAGTYAFFTIPTAGDWTVIFSKQKDLFGAFDYDPKQDALRVTAKPDTTAPDREWMEFGFESLTPASCDLVLTWQRLRLAVPIVVDVNTKVLADCRREIASAKPDDWRTPMRAASWCFDSGTALDEGRGWLDKSIGIQAAYGNLYLRARWQMKDGKKSEALATIRKAIDAGKASKEKVDTAPAEKTLADWQAQK